MNQENKSSPNVMQMVLVGLLIGAAFFIGMLWTKVQTLESTGAPTFGNNGNNGNNAPAAGNNAAPEVGSAKDLDPITKDDWVKGNRNARFALVEYSDIDCPYCIRFHPTAQKLITERKDDFMWVYRNFPLDSLHPNARRKAEAAECAGKIGGNDKFWAFLDEAVLQGSSVGPEKMGDIAAKVGVNAAAFKTCYDGNQTKDLVAADEASGTKAGVQGTPGNILLDTKTGTTILVPGAVPYETLLTYVQKLTDAAK